MKERIHYLDITKGVLILCLMLSHFNSATQRLGVEYEWFKIINYWTPFFACFFMQCFFFISGYCSNFQLSTLFFIKKQIKQIIVPLLAFEIIGQLLGFLYWNDFSYNYLCPPNTTLWFLIALLFARIYCFVSVNYIKRVPIYLGLSLILLFIALFINQYNIIPNYFAFLNCLAACFWVSLGYVLKEVGINNRILLYGAITYITLIVLLKYFNLTVPILDAGVSNVGWKYFPLIILLATSGSFACILISKWINKCRFLEYFGKNSIIVYCIHFVPLLLCIKYYLNLVTPNNVLSMLLLTILIYGTLLLILIFFIRVFNSKYLKWIIGK